MLRDRRLARAAPRLTGLERGDGTVELPRDYSLIAGERAHPLVEPVEHDAGVDPERSLGVDGEALAPALGFRIDQRGFRPARALEPPSQDRDLLDQRAFPGGPRLEIQGLGLVEAFERGLRSGSSSRARRPPAEHEIVQTR